MSNKAIYFSHDSNARSDDKMIALRIKHDWKGYGLYWAIIEKLRDSKHYELSADYNTIAYDLRTDAATIKSIITEFGLFTFTEDGKRFYSESLNNRMEIKDKKVEDAKKAVQARWDKHRANKGNDTTVLQPNYEPNTIKVKQSKVNTKSIESRKKDFSTSLAPFLDKYGKVMLNEFYKYWTEPNKSGTRFKQEMQTTWDLSRRLETWANNDKNFNKGFNKPGTSFIPNAIM